MDETKPMRRAVLAVFFIFAIGAAARADKTRAARLSIGKSRAIGAGLFTLLLGQLLLGQGNGGGGNSATTKTVVTSLSQGAGITLTPNPISSVGTIAINTSDVAQLGTANAFTAPQTIAAPVSGDSAGALTVTNTAPGPSSCMAVPCTIGVYGSTASRFGSGVFGSGFRR